MMVASLRPANHRNSTFNVDIISVFDRFVNNLPTLIEHFEIELVVKIGQKYFHP